MQERAAWVDGVRWEARGPGLSPFEPGYLYGQGAFTTLRTFAGRPFALQAHLLRLCRGFLRLQGQPPPLALLRVETEQALRQWQAAGGGEARIRWTLAPAFETRAEGQATRRVLLLSAIAAGMPPLDLCSAATVVVHPAGHRSMWANKTLNYLPNLLALEEARASGKDEALMISPNGELLEASTANLFLRRGTRLYTPHANLGILPGLTRRLLLHLCARLGIAVEESVLFPRDLYRADEAFLTSSVRGIRRLREIDGVVLPGGDAAPLSRRLHRAYAELLCPDPAGALAG